MGLASFVRALKDVQRFKGLPRAQRRFVFYAENGAAWSHLGPTVEQLAGCFDQPVCYVTSSLDDPILTTDRANIQSFYIGEGTACTYFFMNLRADIVIMTMPDLESFYKKRSRVSPVHYVYVFHSLVSTHMIYRQGAFDHYDTVLAAGPHHRTEIRATEKAYELEAKEIVDVGYSRLDSILADRSQRTRPRSKDSRERRILVAPSWGPQGLLELHSEELVEILLAANYHVTVRPHPETGKRWPKVLGKLEQFEGREGFTLETDITSQDSLLCSELMISDWSGAALEYAFGLERPVLFIDVPRKVNNPNYEQIGHEPIEVSIREKIGSVLHPENLAGISAAIEALLSAPDDQRHQIRRARDETVFNLGSSGKIGAETLLQLATRLGNGKSEP